MEIAFQFLVFRLISEDIVSATAVETCLERETKVFFTFVSRSLFALTFDCLIGRKDDLLASH